jgi:hypothetical protein
MTRTRPFSRANYSKMVGLGLITLCGCQSSIPSMGPLLNQTPTRVPAPATGSFQTPTTYTPQSPTVTGGSQGKVSATSHIQSDGWHSPDTELAKTEASPASRTASASIRDGSPATDPFSVMPASFTSTNPKPTTVGTGVESLPTGDTPNSDETAESPEASSESIDDPRELKPVPSVNVQWRSPNK